MQAVKVKKQPLLMPLAWTCCLYNHMQTVKLTITSIAKTCLLCCGSAQQLIRPVGKEHHIWMQWSFSFAITAATGHKQSRLALC